MRVALPIVAILANMWLPAVISQEQALFVKRDAIDSGKRVTRQTSADQMVQNILQWLQGVYTQNSRRIRQGTFREYLPPTNTQKPRPFESNNQGQGSENNFIGYPPAGFSPQPAFPVYPGTGSGGNVNVGNTGNGGYYPGNEITPPDQNPDYTNGGYPQPSKPSIPFEYLPPGSGTSQPRPFPTITPTGQPTTGYPGPGGPSTGYPTTGYPGVPTTGYPEGPSTGYPGPSTGYPGPSTGYPGPSTGYPGPSTGYPGPSTGYPGPSTGYPGPSTGYPGPSTGYPGPSTGYPGPTTENPGPSTEYPGPSTGYPGPSTGYPGPSTEYPGPSTGYPGPSTEYPGPSTGYPTHPPTEVPTHPPTEVPTHPPTEVPTHPPTEVPTHPPTEVPTHPPTEVPTHPPTEVPTYQPTHPPTTHTSEGPSYTSEPIHPPGELLQTEHPSHPPTATAPPPGGSYHTTHPPIVVTEPATHPPQVTPEHSTHPTPEHETETPDEGPGDSEEGGSDTEEDLAHPPHIHNIEVECAKDMMTINIEFNRKFDGIIYSKGYYTNPDCRYVKENSGDTKYSFTVSLNSCGTEFINAFDTQGQSYLENVLVLQNEEGIQEVWDTIRAVRCLWEGNLNKALSVALSVGMLTQEIVTFSGDTAMAKLDIQMGKGPFAPAANGLVKIGETMTLVVSVSGDSGFDIQVKDCRAKDSTGDNVVALTDDNGCVLKPKLFGAFQKTRNTQNTGASIIAYAFFNAFKFPDVMDLMIECNVELCKTDCDICTDPNQKLEPGRRRRRRDLYSMNDNDTIIGEPVTMGKMLRVILPEDLSSGEAIINLRTRDEVCMSTNSFVFSSALLIILLTFSSLFSAYFWLINKKLSLHKL